MRRNRTEKVHGPYQHRNRWRVVVTGSDGRQTVASFASRAEAEAVAASARAQSTGRTVSAAVDAFEAWQRDRGLAASSVHRTHNGLLAILQLEANGHRPLRWLTPARAEQLYADVQVGRAVDTQRSELGYARALGKFCVKRGWLAANPFAGVEAVGRRKRGKVQLHADEARKLFAVCLEEKSKASIAVAVALLLGLRASEVTNLQARDIDDGGRLVWVQRGKTAAARRTLEVPTVLRPILVELAAGRPGAAWLFGAADIERRSRHWMLHHVGRLCELAGVPVVCVHALRGTHASLATSAGASAYAVASALGHTSPVVTEAHYVSVQSRADNTQRAVLTVLDGGRRG